MKDQLICVTVGPERPSAPNKLTDRVTGFVYEVPGNAVCSCCGTTRARLVLDHTYLRRQEGGGYVLTLLCSACNNRKGCYRGVCVDSMGRRCWYPGMPPGSSFLAPRRKQGNRLYDVSTYASVRP